MVSGQSAADRAAVRASAAGQPPVLWYADPATDWDGQALPIGNGALGGLVDGDHGHRMLAEQLQTNTLPNLWNSHPLARIDGDFRATFGIAAMLLQSHLGVVHVLPVLPTDWPAGRVTGDPRR